MRKWIFLVVLAAVLAGAGAAYAALAAGTRQPSSPKASAYTLGQYADDLKKAIPSPLRMSPGQISAVAKRLIAKFPAAERKWVSVITHLDCSYGAGAATNCAVSLAVNLNSSKSNAY